MPIDSLFARQRCSQQVSPKISIIRDNCFRPETFRQPTNYSMSKFVNPLFVQLNGKHKYLWLIILSGYVKFSVHVQNGKSGKFFSFHADFRVWFVVRKVLINSVDIPLELKTQRSIGLNHTLNKTTCMFKSGFKALTRMAGKVSSRKIS
jgi:hypothetical protein